MGGEKPEDEKVKDPVIEKNLANARAAEEEARKKKESIPLVERMKKTAEGTGGVVGAGLVNLGAQIAAAVQKTGEAGGKVSVSKVVEEEEKLSKEQAEKEV